jgi:hypothetical protein
MSDWEIWRGPDGREVRLRTSWFEGPPVCLGDEDLVASVKNAIASLGPYEETVTVPALDREIAEALGKAGFVQVAYIADHDLAAAHLRQAVAQAERSAIEELKFEQARSELVAKSSASIGPLEMLLAKIHIDRAIEASRNAVILSVAALEAFINQVAALHLGIWDDEEERLNIQTKWILVTRQLASGRTFEKGAEPYQSFRQLVKLRDSLVHPKASEKRFEGPLSGLLASVYRPDWDAQRWSGRWACVVARNMVLEFSRIVGWTPPRWCAAVPPVDPRQPDEWRGAVILAGTRRDPDFPDRHWPPPLV